MATAARDQAALPLVGGGDGAQLALPLDAGGEDRDLIVTAANHDAVALLENVHDWPSSVLILTGPRKSGRSLHARLAAGRSGARVLDGADRMEERRLFAAWEEATATGSPLILIADEPPPAWRVQLPDLRSRLGAAAVATLADPDEAMADALLEKLLWRRGVTSTGTVRRAALLRLERTHLALWRFADRVDGGGTLTRDRLARALNGALAA